MFYVGAASMKVTDQDRAKDFYVNKLGFALVDDDNTTMPGYRWLLVVPPGAQTGVTLDTAGMGGGEAGQMGLLLYTDDIQTLCNGWMEQGVEFREPPAQQAWGWQAIAADPDGNSIVVVQVPR